MHRAGPAPLFPKPATPSRKLKTTESPPPKDDFVGSKLYAGVASAFLLFGGFFLAFVGAKFVWSSAYRDWFLSGLGLAYLIGIFTVLGALKQRSEVRLPLRGARIPVERKKEIAVPRSEQSTLNVKAHRALPATTHRIEAPLMALN